jgi:hypothetical protein
VLHSNRFKQLTSNQALFPIATGTFITCDASQSLKPMDSVLTNSTDDTDRLAIRNLLDNLLTQDVNDGDCGVSLQRSSTALSKRSSVSARKQSFQVGNSSISSAILKLDVSNSKTNEMSKPLLFRDSLHVKDSIDIDVSLDYALPPLQHWFVREKKS